MIIIPENYKEATVSEKIISILAVDPVEFTTRELKKILGNNWRTFITRRAVEKALEKLTAQGVIIKTRENFRNRYCIRPDIIQKTLKFSEEYLTRYAKLNEIRGKIHQLVDGKELKFDTLDDLNYFLEEFEVNWIMFIRSGTDRTIVYDVMFELESMFPTKRSTLPYQDLGIVHFVSCASDDFKNGKLENKWIHRNVFIKHGIISDNKTDIRIVGDYIITIDYPEGVQEKIIDTLSKNSLTPERMREELNQIRGAFTVNAKFDPLSAKQQKDAVLTKFLGPEFLQMINELAEQKKKSSDMPVLDQKYLYITHAQVREMIQESEGVVCSSKKGLITSSGFSFLNKHLINHINNNILPGNSLALIDLGVGPCIKPITIFPELMKSFNVIEYLAVDYSKNVLNLAEKISQGTILNLLDPSFFN